MRPADAVSPAILSSSSWAARAWGCVGLLAGRGPTCTDSDVQFFSVPFSLFDLTPGSLVGDVKGIHELHCVFYKEEGEAQSV